MEEKILEIINTVLDNRTKEKLTALSSEMHLRNDIGFDSLDLAWIYRSYCATCTGHVVPLKTDVISRPNLHINL